MEPWGTDLSEQAIPTDHRSHSDSALTLDLSYTLHSFVATQTKLRKTETSTLRFKEHPLLATVLFEVKNLFSDFLVDVSSVKGEGNPLHVFKCKGKNAGSRK